MGNDSRMLTFTRLRQQVAAKTLGILCGCVQLSCGVVPFDLDVICRCERQTQKVAQ